MNQSRRQSVLGSAFAIGFGLSLFVTGLCVHPAQARTSAPYELIESVPVETSIGLPGLKQTQDTWIELIRSAKTSIDLEQMYLSDAPGEALEPVIQELKLAAQRGVQIRMAMDAKFFSTYPDTIKALDSIPGIRAKLIDFASFGGIMHAKFFIFDRETIFLGSANTDWRALAHIHEIGMRVRVPMVTEQLQSVFDRDWEAGTLVDPSRPLPLDSVGTAPSNVVADPSITFVASPKSANPPGVGDTLSAWIALADSAKVSLYAQFYEYSLRGWKELDDAFRRAAARGVSVRLMVDATKGNKDVEALGRVKNIQVKLVRVPQFSKGPIDYGRLIHSKYLVADQDAFWVGTENGSKGYFLNTRNVGVVVRNPLLAQQLFTVHQSVWDQKYSVLTP